MFWLIFVIVIIIKMSSCGSNAGMETSAPLINAIVNNAVTLAAPDFVMKCIEARSVRWPVVWKFYRSLASVGGGLV